MVPTSPWLVRSRSEGICAWSPVGRRGRRGRHGAGGRGMAVVGRPWPVGGPQVVKVPRRCESMRRALRENAPCALLALAGCATLAWLGLYGLAWSDYEVEALPSLEALVHGQITRFLQLAPVYGGSLIERSPFALLP